MSYPFLTIFLTSDKAVERNYAPDYWAKSTPNEFTNEKITSLITAARNCGIRNIRIVGGEPFYNNDLMMKLLKDLSATLPSWERLQIHTYFSSNITSQIWGFLKIFDDKLEVFVKLDTIDVSKYEKIYGDNLLERVKNNIKQARMAGIAVTIQAVVTKTMSVADRELLLNYAKEQECSLIFDHLECVCAIDCDASQCEDMSSIRTELAAKFSPIGIQRDPGGFGIGTVTYQLINEAIVGFKEPSNSTYFASPCGFAQCNCKTGGYPLLITPDLVAHLCNREEFAVKLGSNIESALCRVLKSLEKSWHLKDDGSTKNQESGIPTGSDLKSLFVANHNLLTEQIGPDAIDLRLDAEYRLLKSSRLGLFHRRIDPWNMPINDATLLGKFWPRGEMPIKGLWLKWGKVLIGRSYEKIMIPDGYIGLVIGRSQWSFLGISVCSDVAKIQSGREGYIRFQIRNNNSIPIRLLPHMFIGQVLLLPITGNYELSEEQHTEEGVTAPPYKMNLTHELHPSIIHALTMKHKGEGLDLDAAYKRALQEANDTISQAQELGILTKPKRPFILSKGRTTLVAIVIGGLFASIKPTLDLWLTARSSSNMSISFSSLAWFASIFVPLSIMIGIILHWRYGYDSKDR